MGSLCGLPPFPSVLLSIGLLSAGAPVRSLANNLLALCLTYCGFRSPGGAAAG